LNCPRPVFSAAIHPGVAEAQGGLRFGYHRQSKIGAVAHLSYGNGARRAMSASGSGDGKQGAQVYAVEVSDHIMVAHSFRGEVFGPAQRLHGATFAVSAAFIADALDQDGIVVDIGRAIEILRRVLAPLNYRNLDEMDAFKSVNTTTEFLTKHVFDGLAAAAKDNQLGRDGRHIAAIRVTVAESPTARAWYEGAIWQQ
jgi:6-pyruvoyl-tetrahydropterin synthase